MHRSVSRHSSNCPIKPRRQRVLAWVCVAFMVIQLFAMSLHKHDLTTKSSDCVACQVAGHFPVDVPAAGAVLLAVFLTTAYFLAKRPAPLLCARRSYLIPSRQAPPF